MMGKLAQKINNLNHKIYTQVTSFVASAKEQHPEIKVSRLDIKLEEDQQFRLTTMLSGLPMRHDSAKKKRVSVFIDGLISVCCDQFIEGYATRVSYVAEKKGKLECIEGFHFDYRNSKDEAIQGGHPIFHCQLEKEAAKDLIAEKRYELEHNPSNQLKTIRLPSSQMDFFSCIIMILADHVYFDDIKDDFDSMIDRVHPLIPKVNFNFHDASTQQALSPTMQSTSWYFACQ